MAGREYNVFDASVQMKDENRVFVYRAPLLGEKGQKTSGVLLSLREIRYALKMLKALPSG